jgi:hypothetical protein
VVRVPASGLADPRGRARGLASHAERHAHAQAPPAKPPREKLPDSVLQRFVRAAVDEVAGVDDRLRIAQTIAVTGWGDVLFVDVYAKSNSETLEDLDPPLRKRVSVGVDWPFERVTIRWRLSY